MFTNLLPLLTTTVVLLGSGIAPEPRILDLGDCAATATATSQAEAPPAITAQLYISYAGNGYYLVVIDGHSSAPNASVGARVYGEDTWLDDFLFSMGGGYSRTDFAGNFNISKMVYKSTLNEDWEGEDEIYAKVDVTGGGSIRTNLIRRSF